MKSTPGLFIRESPKPPGYYPSPVCAQQLFVFAATSCGSSNLQQVLPFWATFEQNIGLVHTSSMKSLDNFIENVSLCANFFSVYQTNLKFPHIDQQDVKWTMTMNILKFHICLQAAL